MVYFILALLCYSKICLWYLLLGFVFYFQSLLLPECNHFQGNELFKEAQNGFSRLLNEIRGFLPRLQVLAMTEKERKKEEGRKERKKERKKEEGRRKEEGNGKKSKIFNPIFCFNYSLLRLCEQQTGKRKMFQKVSGKQDNLHGPPPPPPRPLRPQLRMFLIWKQSVNRVQIYLMSAIISCTKQEQRQQQQQQQQQQRLTRVARRRWRRCYTLAKWK